MAQSLVNRVGTRVVLPIGLALAAVAVLLYTRLPVHGSYAANLLPGFLLTGIGLGLAFVPDSIAALTGARGDEAGAASGLINTSQQIGGAVGIAAITTIATTAGTNFARGHVSLGALLPAASLVHGFQVAFYVLAAVLFGAAVLAAVLIRPEPVAAGAGVGVEPAAEPARGRARRAPSRPQPVRVLGLVAASAPGSDRGSYHRTLFRAAQEQAPAGMMIDEFDVAALPEFHRDGAYVAGAEPVQVARLRTALQGSEAILVATPQYDSGVAGALRNAFAWAMGSDDGRRALAGKPLAVMGPSCDEADMREAQTQIRDVLAAPQSGGTDGPQPLWSCVRGDGRPDGQKPDGEVRESVRGLLVALSDVAQPAEQMA